ncbi:hypothetical protein CBS147343_4817 [Aspergillus niger]|nr:hypothetical protein CBS11350_2452 [Aspergillus niger]KAI2865158.1 hypothetical protein CBS12448_2446 [Aspergillus niger]KAI2882070.1 hypothetical protein CBS13152_8948 [Aspergillus niger]KAI2920966.1 hypothetical protein CBS147371_2815 [Aspergillus niger]KAI2929008.1 hypothetical protein CBS147321_10918 [Aspergillus niger]
MVLRKFSSDGLDSLCTREQLDLLNAIDTLRSQGISHYVSLPQIIVCGDQSSGKSSVLEAISGVSFPVKSNLCTRFPTELVLRKDANVGVRVSIVPHHSRSEAEQRSLGSFCEELDGFDGLPQLVDNAKAAMGISTHGKAFSNDLLRIEVSGPDRPHLTIVDLPGLIHSETKQQSAADVQLVQNVVQSYMKEPRSVILAVISAKNDYANQIVLRLARDADKSGDRTLGVITKPDTLVANSESEKMFISLANNRDVEFRLGWHTLRNMDSDKGSWTLSDRDRKEREFFSQGAWAEMPSAWVGINSLRNRLSKVLLRQIAAELPSLIDEIKEKENDCNQQLFKLGQPRTTLDEQKSYLLGISQSFQALIKAAVDGTYNEPFFERPQSSTGQQKRIRSVIQNLNEGFAERLNRQGNYRKIVENESQDDSYNEQLLITRSEFINHIQELMKQTRGRELPGTFNPMIIGELFKEQCSPWKDITYRHILETWEAVEGFLSLLTNYVADEATSVILFDKVISPALNQLKESLMKACEDLVGSHQQGHPITYNHYFTENIQNIRADRREVALRRTIKKFFKTEDLRETYLEGYQDLEGLVQSLLSFDEPDMMRFASAEALDCMLAYYKVALKRFIDDVAVEVVEVKLVQSLPGLFTPLKVFEMPSELVSRIAGESDENRALRQQLDKKLQILEKGLRTCRQFASDRGVVGIGIKETRHLDGRAGQANALETPQTEAEDDSHPEDADSGAEASILTEQPLEPSDDYGKPAEYSPPVVEDSTCPPETVSPEERDPTPLVYSKKGKKKKNKKMYS